MGFSMGKCCMAEYCIYSDDGINCEAGDISDKLMENCPYLNAIGEIAKLSVELTLRDGNETKV